ncbi:DUF6988 family protein [Cupriavidus pinatubonensis]|uniref:DUF6988 family protein n=1 Tax=Cupriavidus pinatubonensis TaxID=248026 RepID=UPI001CC72544|nr:hypothetical protein [Cupriavidus pinatubonensis]
MKQLIEDVNVVGDKRTRLAVAFQQLAIEHYGGLIRLCTHGQCSSAFALYRPQFEAFVRGAWFHICASDEQADSFLAGKLKIGGVDSLARQIEERKVFEQGLLKQAKDQVYDHLCDLTHGGTAQIRARMQGSDIRTQFKPEHAARLLESAAIVCALSCFEIARVLDDQNLYERAAQAHMLAFG